MNTYKEQKKLKFKVMLTAIKSLVILILFFNLTSCGVNKNVSKYDKYIEKFSFSQDDMYILNQYKDTLIKDLDKGEISNFLINNHIDVKILLKEKLYYKRSCDYCSNLNNQNKTFIILLFESLNKDEKVTFDILLQIQLNQNKKPKIRYRHYLKLIKKQLWCTHETCVSNSTF